MKMSSLVQASIEVMGEGEPARCLQLIYLFITIVVLLLYLELTSALFWLASQSAVKYIVL